MHIHRTQKVIPVMNQHSRSFAMNWMKASTRFFTSVAFQVPDIVHDESRRNLQKYKTGDIVLAKWSDCRSYLAYIMKKEADGKFSFVQTQHIWIYGWSIIVNLCVFIDSYKIRYYDGHVKVVKASFIYPWVGPLPDKLKIFKPKPPQSKRQRSKTIELRKGRGRPITKTTGIGRGLPISAQNRRRTIGSISDAKRGQDIDGFTVNVLTCNITFFHNRVSSSSSAYAKIER